MAAFNSPQLSRFSISECSVCLDAYHPQERIPRMRKELSFRKLKERITVSTEGGQKEPIVRFC